LGHPLPAPKAPILKDVGKQGFTEILRPPCRKRTIVLTVFNFFQAIAFYGFGNGCRRWSTRRIVVRHEARRFRFSSPSLIPGGPLLPSTIAEKYERK
jgi:MFS transporter, putative metabolite:H+ symporter